MRDDAASEDPPADERLDDEVRGLIETECRRLRGEGWKILFHLRADYLVINVDHEVSWSTSYGVDVTRVKDQIRHQVVQYFSTNSEFEVVRSGLYIFIHADLLGALRRTGTSCAVPPERFSPGVKLLAKNGVLSAEEARWVTEHLYIRAYGKE